MVFRESVNRMTYVAGLIILVDDNVGLSSASADLDRGDLFCEKTCLLGSLGLLVASDAVCVLVFPIEAVVIGALLALKAHVLLLVCIGQAILENSVDERLVTELGTGAQVGEIVGSVGHGLSTTCDDNVGGTGENGLGGDNDCLDT